MQEQWQEFARARPAPAVAWAWGAGEATVFFIVPDVWIGLLALFEPVAGFRAAGWSLVGAMAGGAAVHTASARLGAERSAELLDAIPAISPPMIARVEAELRERGLVSMVLGPLSGTPYKLYARAAALQGHPLHVVLLWTVPARLGRFLLSALLGTLAGRLGRRLFGRRTGPVLGLYALFWVAFYAAYFSRHRDRAAV